MADIVSSRAKELAEKCPVIRRRSEDDAKKARRWCEAVAEWTQGLLLNEALSSGIVRAINRTIHAFKCEEDDRSAEIREVYRELLDLISDGYEWAHKKLRDNGLVWRSKSKLRFPLRTDPRIKGRQTVKQQKKKLLEVLGDPVKLWDRAILFDTESPSCEELPSENMLFDPVDGTYLYFHWDLKSSADPFATHILRLLREAHVGLESTLYMTFPDDDETTTRSSEEWGPEGLKGTEWQTAQGRLKELLVGPRSVVCASWSWLALNVLAYGAGDPDDVFDAPPEAQRAIGSAISFGPTHDLWLPFVDLVSGALERIGREAARPGDQGTVTVDLIEEDGRYCWVIDGQRGEFLPKKTLTIISRLLFTHIGTGFLAHKVFSDKLQIGEERYFAVISKHLWRLRKHVDVEFDREKGLRLPEDYAKP